MGERAGSEAGVTLIELLIAMTVMSLGLTAIVAGFSSGILTVVRAAKASTAGTLADQRMESYRQRPYTSLPAITPPATSATLPPTTGTYWIDTTVSWACPSDATQYTLDTSSYSASNPTPKCTPVSGSPPAEALKVVTITVRAGSSTGKILIVESSAFHPLAG